MNKKLNTVFFSICFLAALLAENYCIQTLDKDLFSIIGIGIVVLITAYLLLVSVRDLWKKGSEKTKFVLDKVYQEETEKWNERYNELINLQKAIYTATKKNTATLEEKQDHILAMLEEYDKNNENTLQKLAQLQIRSLEGQKNALNLEINYNRENTKLLIKAIQEESEKLSHNEQLKQIMEFLEKYKISDIYQEPQELTAKHSEDTKISKIEDSSINPITTTDLTADFKKEDTENNFEEADFDDTDKIIPETVSPSDDLSAAGNEEFQKDAETEAPKVIPLYDDPNKALTPEEIANLFASFGS